MKFSRKHITVSGQYFERVTLINDDSAKLFDAMRTFFHAREQVDLSAEVQTLTFRDMTFTYKKIDATTWEVL